MYYFLWFLITLLCRFSGWLKQSWFENCDLSMFVAIWWENTVRRPYPWGLIIWYIIKYIPTINQQSKRVQQYYDHPHGCMFVTNEIYYNHLIKTTNETNKWMHWYHKFISLVWPTINNWICPLFEKWKIIPLLKSEITSYWFDQGVNSLIGPDLTSYVKPWKRQQNYLPVV